MSVRTAVIVGTLWLTSLAGVAVAQREQPRLPPDIRERNIISGGDIGFRIESFRGDTPVGSLVVRVNGQWVEPVLTKKPVLITE